MTILEWLKAATNELADAMFTSPRLDAEIILAHTIKHPRTYLHAHGVRTYTLMEMNLSTNDIKKLPMLA